ncbi:unnamed protein product [Somion occarium]|uniref:Short-chain dehydrogenase/reductase n=1 Tax=Somion occarium TaxID=3059160 RepID=A0ABP1CIU6_9APHY
MSTQKIVLVTGCSKGGIGFSLCEAYAAQGCVVYATARRPEAMEGFRDPSKIRALKLDVLSDENVHDVVKTIIDREGRIDILVNNAGSAAPGAMLDLTIDEARRAFEINTFSVLTVSKAVAPYMAQRKSGTIVNIGSIAAEFPTPWAGIYSATKAAMHMITDTLWMECQPLGINVTLVAPGAVISNISVNAHPLLKIPENTLYRDYIPQIMRRLNVSQNAASSMNTDEFARRVAKETVRKNPPRYLTLGGASTLFKIFVWLPRVWVLKLLWWRFSKP